jgi:hypothetical protein
VDLSKYETAKELEAIGGDVLKAELQRLGLLCGGTFHFSRLFSRLAFRISFRSSFASLYSFLSLFLFLFCFVLWLSFKRGLRTADRGLGRPILVQIRTD